VGPYRTRAVHNTWACPYSRFAGRLRRPCLASIAQVCRNGRSATVPPRVAGRICDISGDAGVHQSPSRRYHRPRSSCRTMSVRRGSARRPRTRSTGPRSIRAAGLRRKPSRRCTRNGGNRHRVRRGLYPAVSHTTASTTCSAERATDLASPKIAVFTSADRVVPEQAHDR